MGKWWLKCTTKKKERKKKKITSPFSYHTLLDGYWQSCVTTELAFKGAELLLEGVVGIDSFVVVIRVHLSTKSIHEIVCIHQAHLWISIFDQVADHHWWTTTACMLTMNKNVAADVCVCVKKWKKQIKKTNKFHTQTLTIHQYFFLQLQTLWWYQRWQCHPYQCLWRWRLP